MDAVANGRALPPRPTLLVGKAGDVAACRSSWARLQPVAEELLRRAEAGCASADELDSAVRRFRSLRESLVAAYVRDELAVQVYECSADVSLAARCWPEFLKSVAALTADLYPAIDVHRDRDQDPDLDPDLDNRVDGHDHPRRAFHRGLGRGSAPVETPAAAGVVTVHEEAQQQEQQQGEEKVEGGRRWRREGAEVAAAPAGAAAADGGGVAVQAHDSGDGAGSACRGPCAGGGRRGEMVSAHCLFLACVPSGRLADAAAQLRNPRTLSYLSHNACSCCSSSPAARYGGGGGGGCSLLRFTVQVLSSLATGDWHSFLALRHSAPRPSLAAVLDIKAPLMRTAALRSLAAAFRALPLPALAAMLHLHPHPHTRTYTRTPAASLPSAQAHPHGGASAVAPQPAAAAAFGPTRGSEVLAALQTALMAAAAAGVRGAAVALEGLRGAAPACAWEGEVSASNGGGCGDVDADSLPALEIHFRG